MKVQKLGHFVDGREVHLFTMENKNGVRTGAGKNLTFCYLSKTGKILWKIPATWEK